MMKIKYTPQFKRDYRKLEKKHYNIKKFRQVLQEIIDNNTSVLHSKYRDHKLSGNLKEYRELHIQPDWLLIYKYEKNEMILLLFRTGSHDELLR